EEDALSHDYPVPPGFRLAVDALPDDPAHPETLGSQEADEVDAGRTNVGWTPQKDKNGDFVYDDEEALKTIPATEKPESLTKNAAGASILTVINGQKDPLHLNHFAYASARFDDTKFACAERSRAGFYRNPEQPYLEIDLSQAYFDGSSTGGYSWTGDFRIDTNNSRMMKYQLRLTNMSADRLAEVGIKDDVDTASNPDMSIMFPFVEDLPTDAADFHYVPWAEVDENHPLSEAYRTDKGEDGSPAANLNDSDIMWTYHIEDENASFRVDGVSMDSPFIGGDIAQKDQLGPNLLQDRKYMAWNFSGVLMPGQTVVLDVMMPVRGGQGSSTISSSLLDCIGYVHKDGRFRPYVPEVQDSVNGIVGWITDTRDANLDGDINQTLLDIQLEALSFKDNPTIEQTKVSSSDLASYYDGTFGGPVPVPEGTGYEYQARLSNRHNAGSAGLYERTVIYDVLPHEGDARVTPSSTGERVARDSQWNGWLKSFDDIELRTYTPSDGVDPERYDVLDENGCDIWVGPFARDGQGGFVPLGVDSLPATDGLKDEKAIKEWVTARYADPSILEGEHFVRLSEMKAYAAAHPEREEALLKGVRAIWAQAKGAVEPPASGRIELVYQMRAPLNLPVFAGDVSQSGSDADAARGLDETAAAAELGAQQDDERATAPADAGSPWAGEVQWNTFLRKVGNEDSGKVLHIGENGKAGAYVNAPSGRGYIGDYVWHDADWNGVADDTANGADDYRASANGRRLLAGVDPATGERFTSGEKLVDLDYDGVADDPGIDGVKVELLNEYEQPVNRDGQAVKFVEGIGQAGEGLWVQCDPVTGDPLLNDQGSYIVAPAGGPYVYTTEQDYYGNAGYFVFSNLAPTGSQQSPGAPATPKYRLRYTFPEQYRNYALTKLETGSGLEEGAAPVGVQPRRIAADDGSCAQLVAVTEPFEVKALDEADPHAYDDAAASYDVGVALPVRLGGLTWRDDMLAQAGPDGSLASEPVDGWVDEQRPDAEGEAGADEARLANMRVSMHEYDPATDTVDAEVALDADGAPAEAVTGDDGAFSFAMPASRTYVAKAENLNEGDDPDAAGGRFLKPTPYLHANDPLSGKTDNDIAALHGEFATAPFDSQPPIEPAAQQGGMDRPVYATDGDRASGYAMRDALAFGFVDSAKGFVGDTVFEDANRDGVRQLDEPGIAGVEVTLEQYWWNEDAAEGAGAWELDPDEPVRTVET
ncbi:MAG: hypothetical protein ACLUCU_09035, partial [Slackia sp.]